MCTFYTRVLFKTTAASTAFLYTFGLLEGWREAKGRDKAETG